MRKIGKFKEIADNLEEDQLRDINSMICLKSGEQEDYAYEFLDDIEDAEVKVNSPNIYIRFDSGEKENNIFHSEMDNLFHGVNVYGGGKYIEDIDGPEEYSSIGFSFSDYVGAEIYICAQSYALLKNSANIIASIIWEVTRYGNTEEERESVQKELEGLY